LFFFPDYTRRYLLVPPLEAGGDLHEETTPLCQGNIHDHKTHCLLSNSEYRLLSRQAKNEDLDPQTAHTNRKVTPTQYLKLISTYQNSSSILKKRNLKWHLVKVSEYSQL